MSKKHYHYKENLEFYVKNLIDGKFTLKQVSTITGYTVQHLCNLKKIYRQKGSQTFINGHRGMPSKNKVPEKIKKRIIDIYKIDFLGFNFNFFTKALKEFYDISYSYKTIYKILVEAGINSPEKRRVKKEKIVHRPRYRREKAGELIQIDATPYQWFSWCGDNSYYALHGAIDDATNEITGLCLTENECSYGYYDILQQTIENKGIMVDIYSDRSAIFCVTPKNKDKLTIYEQLAGIHEKRTQWQRILSELQINQILAWSPQAKGRIERMWRTIQGRLPWYFKKYKIKTLEEANNFLKNKYIRIFNSEFSMKNNKTAWREPPKNYKELLCSKFQRTTNGSGVISFHNYHFLVKKKNCFKEKVQICIYKDSIKALIDGNYYSLELIDQKYRQEFSENILDEIINKYMLSDVKKKCA